VRGIAGGYPARRESSDWSLNRLAELTHLSRQMISVIETARKGIPAGVFVFLAANCKQLQVTHARLA